MFMSSYNYNSIYWMGYGWDEYYVDIMNRNRINPYQLDKDLMLWDQGIIWFVESNKID